MIKNIFFDLDGTLLPMDEEKFTKAYFSLLAKTVAPLGYEPEKLINAVWKGTAAMYKNDGSVTNEQAFWREFGNIYGEKGLSDKPAFDKFYKTEFQNTISACGFNKKADATVKALKKEGYKLVIATNPIFPRVATASRIKWAGIDKNDFLLFTAYEDSHFCKPNLAYYKEILEKTGFKAEECLMVGNDVSEDMIAAKLGMKVFLMPDCLINKTGADITQYPRGGFDELLNYIEKLN